ncbi:MAG: bile acid:sodium symporter, partial [Planctomycetes bacterium]|nr:bile acid:sodium symporter [Planctomycetota bacterium]
MLVVGYVWVRSGLWLGERSGLLVAALMFVMGLGLSPKGILAQLRKARALGLFLLASYLLAPLVAGVAAWVFFRERPDLFTGLIIVGATATTLSSSIVWTRLAGGNDALALVMSIIGNSLQFLVTPTWLGLMLGASVKFEVTSMMQKLLVVVLIPVLASQV